MRTHAYLSYVSSKLHDFWHIFAYNAALQGVREIKHRISSAHYCFFIMCTEEELGVQKFRGAFMQCASCYCHHWASMRANTLALTVLLIGGVIALMVLALLVRKCRRSHRFTNWSLNWQRHKCGCCKRASSASATIKQPKIQIVITSDSSDRFLRYASSFCYLYVRLLAAAGQYL